MAHELASKEGKASMMYCGETPWHRLGQRLDNPATAQQAIVAAGLDYEVELASLFTSFGLEVPHRKAAFRSDTREVLGVVGSDYVPIQNREAFGFLDAVVAADGLRYHTAGALGHGERIWMLAKLPEQICVKHSEDLIDKFLLLSNAHDGTAALRVFFTPVRVVCANTLTLAHERGVGQGISIRHTGNLKANIKKAQELLGLANRFYDDAASKTDKLASHYPTHEQLKQFFTALYPDPKEGKDNTQAWKARADLMQLFETGMGLDIAPIRGTSWAALNAVTEYVDHHRSTTGHDDAKRASRRLNSIWFGGGARLKAKAWHLALKMAANN